METKKPEEEINTIPQEFRIESFQSLKSKLGIQGRSIERLSLPRIIEAAKKHTPATVEKVENYYSQAGWLVAAAELAKRMPSAEALERAEQYYVKSEFYRSAAEVAERIGTPEALQRARKYRSIVC